MVLNVALRAPTVIEAIKIAGRHVGARTRSDGYSRVDKIDLDYNYECITTSYTRWHQSVAVKCSLLHWCYLYFIHLNDYQILAKSTGCTWPWTQILRLRGAWTTTSYRTRKSSTDLCVPRSPRHHHRSWSCKDKSRLRLLPIVWRQWFDKISALRNLKYRMVSNDTICTAVLNPCFCVHCIRIWLPFNPTILSLEVPILLFHLPTEFPHYEQQHQVIHQAIITPSHRACVHQANTWSRENFAN